MFTRYGALFCALNPNPFTGNFCGNLLFFQLFDLLKLGPF